MGTYYLFSDFNFERGFTAEVAHNLLLDIMDRDLITFIASDPDFGQGTDCYAERYLEWFSRIGIHFKKYKVIDNRMKRTEMITCIRNASVVFLMGGMTQVQFEFIKDNVLGKILREYHGCIIGLSAGAINMARVSICTKGSGHGNTEIYEGLRLVDISIDPHFDCGNNNAINELLLITHKNKIYAMCDESAIICRGTEQLFFGDIYMVWKGKLAKIDCNLI